LPFPENIDSLKRAERAVFLLDPEEGRPKASSKKPDNIDSLKRGESADPVSNPEESYIDLYERAERASTHISEPREQFSYRTQKTADLMLIRRRAIDSYKRSREQLHNRTGERAALKLLWR